MSKHVPYEEEFNRKHDFVVEYEFIDDQEDYTTSLCQGMRSDFCYEEDYGVKSIYMIWPEFEDEEGHIILDTKTPIKKNGRARMWIMEEEKKDAHKERLKVGQIGFLVGGSHKIASVKVVEVC